jgi:predicted DNA-binding transcriptional regulator AlpA
MENQTRDSACMPVLADFLDIDQAAAELHVARRTLTRWLTANIAPPSLKVGNRRYFKRTSIIAWLSKKETASTSRRRGR